MASSLYQNNAPGRPPGAGGGPIGAAFRPNMGPQGPLPPPPPPPPPGTYNPNPYLPPPPPPPPPPPMPPAYGAAPPPGPPPPPPPPPPGPQQHLPPPPPNYPPSLSHPHPHSLSHSHPPPHPLSHSHAHAHAHSQHPHPPVHVPMNQSHLPHQNLGHGPASLNQGHNLGYGGNSAMNRPNMPHGPMHSHRPPASVHSQGMGGGSFQQGRSMGPQGTSSSSSRGPSAGPGANQQRRSETEEERRERKKREYERNRAEERHIDKRASQPVPATSRPAPINGSKERDIRSDRRVVAAADKIENRLKRPSTFLCKIRFRNELPDAVSQPRLMHINNDKDQYVKYSITALEKSYKHKLFVEPDLGIPLDLLDLSAYNAPRVKPPMDLEDAELLLDDEVVNRKEPVSIRKKDRPTDKGVAWLVKTQYISPLSLDPAKQAMTEKQAKELKEQREGERLIRDLNDRDQQIHAIEESFRVAKQQPVHQTKPELEPVEVLPLLPDFDRWGDQFVHMIFDTDPTGESELLSKLDTEMRDEIEARAIIKSYSIPGQDDSKPEKFVAYMIPKPEELEKDIYEEDDALQYTWVREYHWDLRTDTSQSTYVFCFGEESVHYLPLHTKLILQKKKAKEGRQKEEDFDHQFPVPSKVTVHRRDLTDEELRLRDTNRHALLEGGARDDSAARQKRRRSPETMSMSSKRKVVHEEAVLNREDVSDEDEEMSV